MFKRPSILLAVGLTAAFILYGLSKDSFVFGIQTGFDTAVALLFLPQMIVAGSFARLVNFSQFPVSVGGSVKISVITALAFFASLLHAWIVIGIWNKFHRKKIIISTAPILLTMVFAFIAGVILVISFLIQLAVAGSFARLMNFSEFPFSISAPGKFAVITVLAFFAFLLNVWIIVGIWNKYRREKTIIPTAPIALAIILGVITGVFFTTNTIIRAREQARRNVCFQNVRTLMHMCYMYADNYGGYFPPSFEALNMAGYEIGNLTSCPTAKGNADYGLNTAITIDFVSDDFPHYIPLLGDFDSDNHGCGGWIYYVDGGMRWHPGSYSAGSGPLENVSSEDWVRE